MAQVTVSVVSTSLNFGQQSTKLFSKYTSFIIHLHKYDATPPEYIYVDLKCQGIANSPAEGRGHLVIYGIEGKQNDVSPDVFDELYYLENGKMNMIVPIDMNNKKITNVQVGGDDGDLVNFQQLNSYVNATKMLLGNDLTAAVKSLDNQINSIKKQLSYVPLGSDLFKQIFDYHAHTLDPDEFKKSGYNITAFDDLEISTSNGAPSSKPMSEFNTKYDFKNFYGRMDVKLNIQNDFTMFFVVKHSSTVGNSSVHMHLNFTANNDILDLSIRNLPRWFLRFNHTWGHEYDKLASDMIYDK